MEVNPCVEWLVVLIILIIFHSMGFLFNAIFNVEFFGQVCKNLSSIVKVFTVFGLRYVELLENSFGSQINCVCKTASLVRGTRKLSEIICKTRDHCIVIGRVV